MIGLLIPITNHDSPVFCSGGLSPPELNYNGDVAAPSLAAEIFLRPLLLRQRQLQFAPV